MDWILDLIDSLIVVFIALVFVTIIIGIFKIKNEYVGVGIIITLLLIVNNTSPGKKFKAKVAVFNQSASWQKESKWMVSIQCDLQSSFIVDKNRQKKISNCCMKYIIRNNSQEDYFNDNNSINSILMISKGMESCI